MSEVTIIIDGNNWAHKAKHAYNLSYDGEDTSVVYGVVRMLQALLKRFKPHSCIICWDGGAPGFRMRLVPQYKSNRKKGDDNEYRAFVSQLVELHRILPYFGILSVRRKGIEADDLMYHASRLIDNPCTIVTTDKDLLQAVNPRVSVLSSKEVEYTYDNFQELVGIPVERFITWKALQGDGSDNIPGCNGIGPVFATKIVMGQKDELQEKLKRRLDVFLLNNYSAIHDCINLEKDMAGARMALLQTDYVRFNNAEAMDWCIQNGFTSILEAGSLGVIFGGLSKPIFDYDVITPRVWDYIRSPVCEVKD